MNINQLMQHTLLRPVNSGFSENDMSNIIRFNHGLQKYIFRFIEQHPEIPVEPVVTTKNFFGFITPHYFAWPIATCTIGLMNRRIGPMAIVAGFFAHKLSISWAYMRANRAWQEYLLLNFKHFDQDVKDALETGDARYLRNYIDYSKSDDDLLEDVKAHIMIQ